MAEKKFPRPNGGPEPIAQGVTDNIPNSDAPSRPGYDYSGSLDGASTADLKRGYRNRTKITDAGSDPADWIHPTGSRPV